MAASSPKTGGVTLRIINSVGGSTAPGALPMSTKLFGRRLLCDRVFQRLEAELSCARRRVRKLADRGPCLFVIRKDELVDAWRNNVALHSVWVSKQHERFFSPRRCRRIEHGLRRSVIVVNLDQVAGLHLDVGHVLRVHLDQREGRST